MYTHFENVLVSDPLRLKKYHSPHYKKVYTICVLIPTLLAFAIVFFLIFYMSPRGMSMRQYQRDIYDWNKEDMASLMSTLSFGFKIMPYLNKNYTNQSMLLMQNKIGSNDVELSVTEKTLNNMLKYKQSYFAYSDTFQVFPKFSFSNVTVPVNSSEDYCLHLWWKPYSREKIFTNEIAS